MSQRAQTDQRPEGSPPPGVPEDVVTGFWLWVVALPLMVTGFLVDLLTGPAEPWFLRAFAGFGAVALAAIAAAFLLLLRQGYRWTRTLLTGGGAASVVLVVGNLFAADRPAVAAAVYALCVIVGSVLIAGGAYLLHRKDAHEFFTR